MFKAIEAALKDHPVKLSLKTGQELSVDKIVAYITNDKNEVSAIKFRGTDGKSITVLNDSIEKIDI